MARGRFVVLGLDGNMVLIPIQFCSYIFISYNSINIQKIDTITERKDRRISTIVSINSIKEEFPSS